MDEVEHNLISRRALFVSSSQALTIPCLQTLQAIRISAEMALRLHLVFSPGAIQIYSVRVPQGSMGQNYLAS